MKNLQKIKLEKCQPPPPFKQTCPCTILPPLFLIFHIFSLPSSSYLWREGGPNYGQLLHLHSIIPHLSAGGNDSQSQILKTGDQKNMTACGDLKSSCHKYLPREAFYVSCQKKTFKNKIWLFGLNFKFDLGLFQPNNLCRLF